MQENKSKHLRKYFLFNYENGFRTMMDNDIIGLSGAEKDLSSVYNAPEPKFELFQRLNTLGATSNDVKDTFDKFLFLMEIGDAVCLSDSKSIWAVGIIESNYQFNKNKELPHARKVKWIFQEKFDVEDGNHRIKIREVEKESTYIKIEEVINEAMVNEDDNGLLINYPSRVTVERYNEFFKQVHFNPHEIELLNIVYCNQPSGISVFELRKQFEGINVDVSIEALSRKISRKFRLSKVEGRYSPNLFNGVLRDGHLCLVLKDELSKALVQSKIVSNTPLNNDGTYTVKMATTNSVYPKAWFEEALSLLKTKRNLMIIGSWGTGKSYFARRLAFLTNNSRDMENILHIKMHQSLTYQELLVDENKRILYRFIEKARKNSMDNYVIIFEDCHEVNLTSVIGEISYLLEDNNREREAALDVTFDDNKYYIPKNVYVITTSRDTPGLFTPDEISNVLTFEMKSLFNDKFINMFEDVEFGQWIAKTYTSINKILDKYKFSINHGLFLKNDRGVSKGEYEVVIRYKIGPILKRIVNDNDYQKIQKLLEK
ncbi:broad-specificity NMP kinase [Bacilli bacterium PM5-9]|nr:broad-specificity NMP kinase [Bacilli bacterium PM5-9]